jgi:hypothetical protein
MYAAWLLAALSLGVASFAVAANVEEIPLRKIWAFNMEGTRPARALDPKKDVSKSLSTLIQRALIDTGGSAGPCFAVNGVEKVALVRAARVLVDGIEARPIKSGGHVSLVFYSKPAPGYVILDSVTRDKQNITVKYKVIVHITADVKVHYALIPLGKLAPGTYKVDIVEVDGGKGPRYDAESVEKAVCDSSSFTVQSGVPK